MKTKGIQKLRIGLASPEIIRSWSYGEVLEPETINYRRLRPEKDGLFCEAIFGPTRDYQCHCGKYKNIRYKGIVCDKCGVEVTRSAVRRERMGHIELAAPVAHLWFSRRIPSILGRLLDMSRRDLDRVLYFAQYIVTYVDEEARKRALEQLDTRFTSGEGEVGEDFSEGIKSKETEREDRLKELEAQQHDVETRYDEQIAADLEPVIKQGQRLEKTLQESVDEAAKDDLIFPETDVVIVKKGNKISTAHIANIQDVVKQRLTEIEESLKEAKENELEHIKLDVARVRAETSQEITQLRDNLDLAIDSAQSEYKRLRDELLNMQPLIFLGEAEYRELRSRWGQVFQAEMGAEAFYDILKRLDLDALSKELWNEIKTTGSKQKRKKAIKRLKVVDAFQKTENQPEWMILTVLPVIPPDLRPMVQLDGGRFATSDLNDLYRRVINRNNRLKRLLELGAPDVIVRNEKRMLQEAVDSLIDNSQRGKALSRRGRRELKSLSDMLKGKKGRFRRNLLGKRVDYSGRSVIVSGPKLKMSQCGLPKKMALELFRPFVISILEKRGFATNVKGAKRLIERNRPEVWEALEEAVKSRPVLLNRAPTLHRLGIQAFEVELIEGSAIQLHPLVCPAFNADFDGDQMAVHVPLSQKAVTEARELMLSTKNLLKPANGEPIIAPSKDMVLGVFFLTRDDERPYPGDGRIFSTMIEVETAYLLGQVKIPTKIKILAETWYDEDGERMNAPEERVIDTTVGRTIFNLSLPYEVQFMNWPLVKGDVKDLITEIYEYCDNETTTWAADSIKDLGFEFATKSGYSIAVADLQIPPEKEGIVAEAFEKVGAVERSFRRGLLTAQEQDDRLIDIWQKTTADVGDAVKANMNPHGNMAVMALSGATKGGFGPVSQLAGMRGLMADPSGQIIPVPIRSSFREGLTALEYFISSHGARKGLADTALRTADAGYLTRRLVDVSQDAIINNEDCGTDNCIVLERSEDVAGQTLQDRVFSRVLADHVVDQETGEVLVEKNTLVSREIARRIQKSNVDRVKVFSPLTCTLEYGLCAKCYGLDLGRGQPVEKGATVGIVAAQSIGEPGTQLTLRTFHTGGVAAASDITTGLPRVEELFEARKAPKGEAVLTEIAGRVSIEKSDRYSDMRVVRVTHSEMISDAYDLEKSWRKRVKDEDKVEEGDVIASLDADNQLLARNSGRVRIEGRTIIVSYEVKDEKYYDIPSNARLAVEDGEMVEPAQRLTEGSLNTHDILRISGRDACQKYMLLEVQRVYRSQGQNIHDKHFEIVIAKMMSRVNVTDSGGSDTLPRELANRMGVIQENEDLLQEGKQPLKYDDVLLGITKAALNTNSFLSAASFQHTIKILTQAAVNRDEDPLFGLKENVIIGKLIPAGTGFIRGPFAPEDEKEAVEEDDAAMEAVEEETDLGEITEDTVVEELVTEVEEEK